MVEVRVGSRVVEEKEKNVKRNKEKKTFLTKLGIRYPIRFKPGTRFNRIGSGTKF